MSFNALNNRISTNGYSYDLAGNLSGEPNTDGSLKHSYTYDAENRVKTVDGAASYVYDGEGNRVRKLVGENLLMVYGITGELLTEYDGTTGTLQKEYIYGADGLVASIEVGVGTHYVTADALGSPRIITSTTGAVISRHDYQPFGEELYAGVGGRTTVQGYSNPTDSLRQKFTGKERDDETGLDYFLARYYSSVQGRFTSIDPILIASERLADPQRINLYVYTRNNPLKYIDPLGESINVAGAEADRRRYEGEINKRSGLAITIDKKGNVGYAGGKRPGGLTGAAAKIADAIDNKKTVNISLVRNDGQVDFGSPYSLNSKGNLTASVQRIDYSDIDVADAAGIPDYSGESIVEHETIEAIGIQIEGKSKEDAHEAANKFAPGLQELGPRGAIVPVPEDGSILGFRQSYQVERNGGSIFTIDSYFATPFRPSPGQKPPANAVEVERFRATNPIHVRSVFR